MSADRITPVRPTGPPQGSGFGDPLRREREARGLTLDAVADATRIARHHLEALERSDLGALPSGPFGKGYLRSYAKLLGLDPEPILEAYRAMERQRGVGSAEAEQRMLGELSHLVEQRTGEKGPALRNMGRARLVLALAGLVLVAGALVSFLTGRQREPSVSPPPSTLSQPSPAVAEPRPLEVVPARGGERPESRTPRDRVKPSPPPPSDALEVSDHGVGSGLTARSLVGQADRFPEGTRVAFWTRVVGGRSGHVIRHVWFREGQAVMRADLPVGGSPWRTYSRLILAQAGSWAVEARTSDGRLLARQEFLCEPGER